MRKSWFRGIVFWILWRQVIAFLTIHCDPSIALQNDWKITTRPQGTITTSASNRRMTRQCIAATKKDLDSAPKEGDEAYLQDPKFIERNKRWIVIVDDEEPIRMAVGDFLYDQGYQLTACADADAMLQLCSSSSDEDPEDGELQRVPDAIIR